MSDCKQIEARIDEIDRELAAIDLRHHDYRREARSAIARGSSREEKAAIKARAMKDTALAGPLARERELLVEEMRAHLCRLVEKLGRARKRFFGDGR